METLSRYEDAKSYGKKDNIDGFTLVEIIVVLIILGILSASVIPVFAGQIEKARQNAAMQECKHVVLAAQVKMTDLYANGKADLIFEYIGEIEALAGVKGAVTDIRPDTETVARIAQVGYKATNGIDVIYDIHYEANGREALYSFDGVLSPADPGGSGGGNETQPPDGGEGEDGDNQPEAPPPSGGELVVREPDGTEHTLYADPGKMQQILEALDYGNTPNKTFNLGIFGVGTLLSDETGFYVIKQTDNFNWQGGEVTLQEIMNRYPTTLERIDPGKYLFTSQNIENNQWKEVRPKAGDIAVLDGKIYIARHDAGQWSIPGRDNVWIEIKQ